MQLTRLRLLTDAAQITLGRERQFLADVRVALQEFGAPRSDQEILARAETQLEELFLLVIVGEFNAGKSAVTNVLLGDDVLEEGVTPTTSRVTVVRFGDERKGPTLSESGVAEVTAPVDLLRTLHVVDTPGTNAVLREHELLTREFVPRADLVLFITSADRPFTESERQFLERIRDWGKKTVLVINKADILGTVQERETVAEFVRSNATALLGVSPALFLVSARRAKAGRTDDAAWESSGFAALQEFLQTTLDEAARLRLKLLNPLGIAQRLVRSLNADVTSRRMLLDDDLETLTRLEGQLTVYEADLRRDFAFRMADVDKLLLEMEQRGHDHFDETIRLARVVDLLNKPRMQQAFEQRVVADTPQRIDRRVNEVVDWLVDADYRQWQAVNEVLSERRSLHRDRVTQLPPAGGALHDRARVIESVGRQAERIVETYDRVQEANLIAEKARTAVAASAAIEVGAVGLGAMVATIATTAAADMTGLAMAGVVATLGLLVIPNRRRQAKQELREKVTALRERLSVSLRDAFDTELRRSEERIRGHIEPYSRFVRAEQQHVERAQEVLDALDRRIDVLRDEIERLTAGAPSSR